ncbi:uncharacterized protein LOC131596933 [Vicia villosa]|uniref:uncharacterized protein LOC131596933 n=1 Tax=Vicia villosa TaxID=3911 RepID=UPI00273C280C|nr:uncharacterized protein LOC131596933 [Vicia villosa]
MNEEVKKKDSSSGTCSRNLFNASSSQSRCDKKEKELADENEVQQPKEGGANIEKNLELNRSILNEVDIETVAESLRAVDLSLAAPVVDECQKAAVTLKRRWERKKEKETRYCRRSWSNPFTRGGVGSPTPYIPMKILSWNCRGLGHPRAVQALSKLTKLENPSLVFLMETKLKAEEMQTVMIKTGFRFAHSVDCRGSRRDRAGGLCLIWKEPDLIKVLSFSENYIRGSCHLEEDGYPWFFSCFYGFSEEHLKRESWRMVQEVSKECDGNFICFGDFNDTIQEGEKMGGNGRTSSQFAWGRQTLETCNLLDLGFSGYKFTWTNGRRGTKNIQCRLDRALANNSFLELFPLSSNLQDVFKEYRSGNINKELKRIEGLLQEEVRWFGKEEDIKQYKALEHQRNKLLCLKETVWRQRSRAVWLKEGDRNTRFFHAKANQRRKTNRIKRMMDSSRRWGSGPGKCEKILLEYFEGNFSSSNPSEISSVCSVTQKRLSKTQKEWCAKPFSPEEVKIALFQMNPSKAPGPDGLNTCFFQKYWNIVGKDVVSAALDILNNGKDSVSLNSTFICLIPKLKNHKALKDFKPISLCNVVMKVITKSIANRLKDILPDIVSEEQSAFVKGRLITHNGLIDMDCFHWMKNKKEGKKGVMALKLDMSKAYDRMFHLAAESKDLHGIKVARQAPSISHLFFADDSLLFARANEAEADRILYLLQRYQKAPGQMVNIDKSGVSFSGNVSEYSKEVIRRKLGFKCVNTHTKYLGLPVVFGRSKKEVFALVLDKAWKKVKGWKEGFLSKAGKEVLIKAVAQTIPTYIMSCYKIQDSC